MLFAAVVLIYYFLLNVPLALAMLVITSILVFVGHKIAELGDVQGSAWFALLFVGGWILQLVGHVFEGRKPNFLAAEVFFALGYKPHLHREVQRRAVQLSRAQSVDSSISFERTSSKSGASGSRSA